MSGHLKEQRFVWAEVNIKKEVTVIQHQHQAGLTCLSITDVYKAPATWRTACCVLRMESDHIKLLWRLADWQWSLAGQQETSGLHHDLCDMKRLGVRPEDRTPSKKCKSLSMSDFERPGMIASNIILAIYNTNRAWLADQGTGHLLYVHHKSSQGSDCVKR